MAKKSASKDRLAGLRVQFNQNIGKQYSPAQIEKTVGASYWRACVKDLQNEGMVIEAVRNGRTVVGYRCLAAKGKVVVAGQTHSTESISAVAASKPKTAKKVTKTTKPVKATKAKTSKEGKIKVTKGQGGQPTAVDVVHESDEDSDDVIAILKRAGLE